MALKVAVEWLAEGELEATATSHHRVVQPAERQVALLEAAPAEDHRAGAVGIIAAQTLAERGEREATVPVLVKGHSRPPVRASVVQRGRMGAEVACNGIAVARTVRQRVAEADAGCGRYRLRETVRAGKRPSPAGSASAVTHVRSCVGMTIRCRR